MHYPDSSDAVLSLPADLPDNAPGPAPRYFDNGTTVRPDWCNAVLLELIAILVGRGVTPTKALKSQIWDAIKGAIQAVEGRTGSGQSVDVTTQWLRGALASFEAVLGDTAVTTICNAVIASTGSAAIGNCSAVVGSVDSEAGLSGAGDFASFVGGAQNGRAIGAQSAVAGGSYGIASGSRSASLGGYNSEAVGTGSAVAACYESTASGDYASSLASESSDAGGDYALVAASSACAVPGNYAASLASAGANVSGNRAAAIASSDAVVEGADAAVIASVAGSKNKGNFGFIAASNKALQKGTNAGVSILSSLWFEPTAADCPAYSVGGGYDASLVNYSPYTWRIESNGGVMRSFAAHTTSGLDYAEMFECVEPIPPGAFAGLDVATGKARLARSGDDFIGLGSANPTVVGGDDGLAWQGRYLRDEWGGIVYEEVETVEVVTDRVPLLDEHGQVVTETETREGLVVGEDGRPKKVTFYTERPAFTEVKREVRSTVRQPKRDPRFDPSRPYVPRLGREGWALLGLTGQMRARVGADVFPGDYLQAGPVPGVAVAGSSGYGMSARVMRITQPFDEAKGYAIALCLVR